MRYREIIKETLEQWNTGIWIHYSDQPFMKISPKQFHQDPSGIYLFPEKFNPYSIWKNKKYKFTVELKPDIKILDVAKMSKEDVENFTKYLVGDKIERYHDLNKEYPMQRDGDVFGRAWNIMRSHYAYESGIRLYALFNKKIREYGYDAIFDDVKAIHNAEVQLLVLNPTKIKILKMEERKDNAFNKVTTVMKTLENILKEFGNVEVEQPKLKNVYGQKELQGKVSLKIGKQYEYPDEKYSKNKYMDFSICFDKERNVVHIHLSYSNPRIDYGVGATISDANHPGEWESITNDIKQWMEK